MKQGLNGTRPPCGNLTLKGGSGVSNEFPELSTMFTPMATLPAIASEEPPHSFM
jgi:hypothetical protein